MNPKLRLDLLLSRITYKNGWKFETQIAYVGSGPWNGDVVLYISRPEPDATDPRKTTMIAVAQSITKFEIDSMTDRQVIEWIFRNVAEAEMHEVREWLKFDGATIENPHPPPVTVMTEAMWKSV